MNREERSHYLGATDIAAVLNVPPYGCSRRLWFDKKLTPEDYPEDREGLFALGHALEPECRRRYIERTGAAFHENPDSFRAEGIPDWLRAHPDGVVEHKARKGLGDFEAKTFSGHAWAQMVWSDGMPKAYILQLQTQLFQSGFKWGIWAALNRENGKFLTFDIDRDDPLIADITRAATDWWEQFMIGDQTPLGWRDRCHEDEAPCARCSMRHTCLGGKLRAAVEDLAEARKLRGDLSESTDERLSRLLARRDGLAGPRTRVNLAWEHINQAIKDRLGFLGEPDGVCLNGRRVTAYEQIRSRWDESAMRSAGAEVGRYKIPGAASRSLKVGKEK